MDEDGPLAFSLQESEKVVIKQKVELLEAFANAAANALDMDALGALGETANQYNVYTDDGGEKFKVVEQSEYCGLTGRCCCRPNHKLQLHVYAPEFSNSDEAMIMDRPCKCGQCCSICGICQQEMRVYDGSSMSDDKQIAYIKQPFLGGIFNPTVEIMDREGSEPVATVAAEAMCCIGGICCDHTFSVKGTDGSYMGKIVKERPENMSQIAKELGTDADNFTLYFSKDLSPQKKAAMFASMHLIDYMLFEDEGDFNCDVVNGQCQFKCCDLYCCGCVCPCTCSCGGGGGDEEGGGGDE